MITLARNRRLGLGLAALTALLDQASKAWVLGPLQLPAVHLLRVAADPATPDLPLLPVFGFTFTQNFGVSLGLLTAGSEVQRWALVGLTAAIALTAMAGCTPEGTTGGRIDPYRTTESDRRSNGRVGHIHERC